MFDGHNDVLLRLFRKPEADCERLFLEGEDDGHLDLPRALKGGFAGGLFAIYVPSTSEGVDIDDLMQGSQYDVPLPSELEVTPSLSVAVAMAAILFRIERTSEGRVRVCRDAGEIRTAMEKGQLATVLHIEGAEPIDAELKALDILHAAGLRSIGPVWSRPNIFGHGVPFRFPSSPDTGPGLTEAGERLVKRCNELKVAIDLSHLNEAGFWDVARLSDAPLIATHSNAHVVCPHARNLTDKQLDAIAERRGIVGLNYAASFLRPDGQMNVQTGFDIMLRHLDHLIGRLGVEGVALGSDFDGAKIPAAIGDVAGLPDLVEAMRGHGYDETTIRKICHENWIDVLGRTWGR
ncbi:MAG: dipeptidase [Parvibaculaceae bacterium]